MARVTWEKTGVCVMGPNRLLSFFKKRTKGEENVGCGLLGLGPLEEEQRWGILFSAYMRYYTTHNLRTRCL